MSRNSSIRVSLPADFWRAIRRAAALPVLHELVGRDVYGDLARLRLDIFAERGDAGIAGRAQKAHNDQKSEQARHFNARRPRIGGVYLFSATVYATAGFRYKYIMSDIVTHNAAQSTADAAAQPAASSGPSIGPALARRS